MTRWPPWLWLHGQRRPHKYVNPDSSCGSPACPQSCPLLHISSPGETKKSRFLKISLLKSYPMADLTGARSWEKWLWSVFLCHPSKQKYFHRAKGKHLFYIQWFHQHWRAESGPECEAEFPPGRPSPPAPHERGRQKHFPTTSNICLQLETTAKPCSPGSLYEWRTNALIWIYKNLHSIWGQPM